MSPRGGASEKGTVDRGEAHSRHRPAQPVRPAYGETLRREHSHRVWLDNSGEKPEPKQHKLKAQATPDSVKRLSDRKIVSNNPFSVTSEPPQGKKKQPSVLSYLDKIADSGSKPPDEKEKEAEDSDEDDDEFESDEGSFVDKS